MPEKMVNATQRFLEMFPAQQRRIFVLRHRIRKCEGIDMPYKYWCPSCKAIWNKINDVFLKFEKKNMEQTLQDRFDASAHNFSKPDSTGDHYE